MHIRCISSLSISTFDPKPKSKMALATKPGDNLPREKTKVAVEEEEFNKDLTNIIQRDFFPELESAEGNTSKLTEMGKDNPEIEKSRLSLDQYLNRHESEDDTSFAEMLVKSKELHDQKHAWLHNKEQEYAKLTSDDIPALPAGLNSWTYTAKNSLMYVPDGVESSAVEMVQGAIRKREIAHSNTRLPPQFVHKCQHTSDQPRKPLQEKVGVDGKILSEDTPEINGYGFLSTPQIQPGIDASPLMTWGSIEGTPMRIDSDSRPLTARGPSFKMPKIPTREKVALRLVDQVAKATRERRKHSMSASPLLRGRAGTTPSKLDRLKLLSPAARKLISDNKYSDKALNASYSPYPNTLNPGLKTPSRSSTPIHHTPSITDDLLNIAKKKS